MNHDLRRTAAFYDDLAGSTDDDRTAVGWRTSYAQDVAFLSLARVDGLRDGARVLDVGCGLGGLLGFFERAGLRVDYTGVDLSENMIAGARERHPGARFEVRDIMRNPPRGRYDIVMCSGALSHRTQHHAEYVHDMIATMYGLCDGALAFNLLSAYAYVTRPKLQTIAAGAAYEWPSQILDFCKTQSEHVALHHDTDSGVFSVFVYRRNRAALERFLAYVKPGKTYDRAVRAAIDYHVELELWDELVAFLGGIEPCPAVSFFLGQAHAALGDAPAAEAAFRAAIAADPKVPWPYIRLGYLLSRLGDTERALAAAREAVRAAPADEAAHEALVKILYANRRLAEARAAAAAMPDGPLADNLRGIVADSPRAALEAIDRSLAAAPQYLPSLIARADLIEQAGDRSAAIEAWRAAQRVAPIDRSIANRLAALTRTKAKDDR